MRNGTVTVILKDKRSQTTDQFKQSIRAQLRQVPDVRITTAGGWGGADVEVVLSSQNGPNLERAQFDLMRQMRGLNMISDVRPAPPPAGPELVVRPKPEEAARLGVTSSALAREVQITAQAMGATLSALRDRGLVERHRDPDDGRRVVLTVTGAGLRSLKDKRDARAELVAQALTSGAFTKAELKQLAAAAALLERLAQNI